MASLQHYVDSAGQDWTVSRAVLREPPGPSHKHGAQDSTSDCTHLNYYSVDSLQTTINNFSCFLKTVKTETSFSSVMKVSMLFTHTAGLTLTLHGVRVDRRLV